MIMRSAAGLIDPTARSNTVIHQSELPPLFQTASVIDDKWVLIERIGKGGMGEVLRAHQLNLDRDMAIQIISEKLLQSFEGNPEEKAGAFERLQREVKTMARVCHPNVLPIFNYGTFQDQTAGAA
jgi:serine/threonine protein kinase